jgi:tetratricopeptide (TPR) repeat protein
MRRQTDSRAGMRRPRLRWWLAAAGAATLTLIGLLAAPTLDREARLRRLDTAALQREARARPNDPELFLELSRRLRHAGELRAAAVMSRRAYDLSDGEPRFVAARVAAMLDMGQTEEALEVVTQALTHWPASGELRAQLAAVQARRGRFTDALREARQAVRQVPEHAEAWRALGAACTANKQPEEAFAAFERARSLEPRDAELLADYGESLARFGRTAQAEPVLEQSRRYAPRAPRPTALLGQVKASRARTREERAAARELLREGLRRAPTATDTMFHLALLEEQEGEYLEAVRLLKACLAEDPGYGEAHLALGRVYQRQGRVPDARRAFAAWQRFSDYRRQAAHLELRLRRQPGDAALLRRMVRLHDRYGNRIRADQYRGQLDALMTSNRAR